MFNQFARFIERHRLAIPDRYCLPAKYRSAVFLSSFLITFGALVLLLSVVLGVQLLNQPSPAAPKASKAEIEQIAFELRAHAFTELATVETQMFRQSLENFRLAAAQDQRDAALRHAKAVRANALQHLVEAEAIAAPMGTQPDIATLRAEIAELDRQLTSMQGTQGN